MRDLSAQWNQSLHGVSEDDPLILLVQIETDDQGGVVRYVAYTDDQTWSGDTYTRYPIARAEWRQSLDGGSPSLELRLTSVDQAVVSLLENNSLIGRRATLTVVLLSRIGEVAANERIQGLWRILSARTDDNNAWLNIGAIETDVVQAPYHRAFRDRCTYVYRDPRTCNYPSDRFGGDSRQNFRPNNIGQSAVTPQLHGWFTVNADRADFFDVDTSNAGQLTCTITAGNDGEFINAVNNQPVIWKGELNEFSTDVDYWMRVTSMTIPPVAGANIVQLMFWSQSDTGDWVSYRINRQNSGNYSYGLYDTINGVTTQTPLGGGGADLLDVRIQKVGAQFTLFSRLNDDDPWTQRAQITRNDLLNDPGASIAINFGKFGGVAEQVQVDRIVFIGGGLLTCDRGLNTTNGCAVHNNTHRYGGHPAMLRF